MARTLPDYSEPPLNEVIFGIQFKPLASLRTAHLGEYWHDVKPRYPQTEDQLPIAHVIEPISMEPKVGAKAPEFEFSFPFPRCWFVNPSGAELIQLQQDRFLRNWRQTTASEEYPRYERLFGEFLKEWTNLESFLGERNLGALAVDQCELTYINHVWEGAEWKTPDLTEIFSFWAGRDGYFADPEGINFKFSRRLPESHGRLHATINQGFRPLDKRFVIQLELTARGDPGEKTNTGIGKWFDLAHAAIVNGFTDLTTAKMHAAWGRKT